MKVLPSLRLNLSISVSTKMPYREVREISLRSVKSQRKVRESQESQEKSGKMKAEKSNHPD